MNPSKINLVIIFVLLCSSRLIPQFAFLYGSPGQEYGKANCVDADTCYIEAALFQNTINVHPYGTLNLTSNGMVDVVLAKYDKRGNLLWGKRFGGTNTTDAPHGVATDAGRNIYVAGYFGNPNFSNQNVSFNPDGGGVLTTRSGFDAFLAKYDKNGNYVWALGLGNTAGSTEERCWDIHTDADGNSLICGGFSGTVDFNPRGTPNVKSVTSGVGLFLAKYDSSGTNKWAIVIDAKDTSVFFEAYAAVDEDASGNIYLAGNFRGSNVNFDPNGSALLSSAGQTDMFLAKYRSDGSFVWVKRIGGTMQDIVSPGALRLDKNGLPFFTGRIAGTVNFSTTGGVNNVSGSSLFLAGYDTAGALRYAFGMPSNPGDGGHRIGFDSDNNIYIAGWINGTVDFDPSPNSYSITAKAPTADAFIAKYSNSGNIIWANSFGAANSSENNIAAGLVIDQDNNAIITGQLYGTNADFDPSPSSQYLLSSAGQNDCFIAKYDSSGRLWRNVTNIDSEDKAEAISLRLEQNYPNPFIVSTNIKYTIPAPSQFIKGEGGAALSPSKWERLGDPGDGLGGSAQVSGTIGTSGDVLVTLKLYDILGREIATLVNEYQHPGVYEVKLNAKEFDLSGGIYFYEINFGGYSEVKKMLVFR
ncbi:MAG: SBBP repeat-containing protein [Ignavibacteriaceae bacterium]|nr:SBBP repeat-containing protein [Ignavibacteriaceae bacterium]